MVTAIIVAGGKGKRMGQVLNKQFIKIGNKEILARTIEAFQNTAEINEIIVVCSENGIEYCKENIIVKYGLSKAVKIVPGGRERQDSVRNGLNSCNEDTSIVVIHDGARPFVTSDIIRESIICAEEYGACTAAVPTKDTIKKVGEDKFSIATPNREGLYAVQTPQGFKYDLILEAHKQAKDKNILATDDTMLVENMGSKVKIIAGSNMNIKITTREDLIFADAILKNNLF
ncbi:MAG: ispD [Clostridiales bacterium]|jgi:2-C-methyl-D-erythritol 4-phosphate cytidylyltransferase|nr:ispD [Clostridiales bacterium]